MLLLRKNTNGASEERTVKGDEKKPEDASVELSVDDLEEASDGYILVRDGVSCPYVVIDDETGQPRLNTNMLDQAEKRCAKLGVSNQKICHDEYKQIYGHRRIVGVSGGRWRHPPSESVGSWSCNRNPPERRARPVGEEN